MTLPELVRSRSSSSNRFAQYQDQWSKLTPRTLVFSHFFAVMQIRWTSAQYVEALSAAGADPLFLETLPEAVLAPLQEAIVQCQTEPPLEWSKDLLGLVKREDVNMLLNPGQKPPQTQSTLLVSYPIRIAVQRLTMDRHHLTKLALTFVLSAHS